MDTLTLTKKLIEIPSYVSNGVDESAKGEFIYQVLKRGTTLNVTKQYVKGNRFNIIARDTGATKILLAGHIDTVEPKARDLEPQFVPTVNGNRLYGLGAVDMLSGVASVMSFLLRTKTRGVCALFYVDEEYDFSGMMRFIREYKNIGAKVCVITEPTNLQICNAHRGLIEVEYIVTGKTAHASRPKEGVNAITNAVEAVEHLSEELSAYRSRLVGVTTSTLSKIEGGLDIGTVTNVLNLSKGTNSVPDICKVRLDIRPALVDLNEEVVRKIFKEGVKKLGCSLVRSIVIQDLGCLSVERTMIKKVISAAKSTTGSVEFINPNDMGYGDGQMIFEKIGIPTVYFGAGPTNMCHKPDEFVNISDLPRIDAFLDKLYSLYQ